MKLSEAAKANHFYKANARSLDPPTAEAGWRAMSAGLAAQSHEDDERYLKMRVAAGLKSGWGRQNKTFLSKYRCSRGQIGSRGRAPKFVSR